MLEVAVDPDAKVTGVWALTLKSGEVVEVNVNTAIVVWISVPLVPVTVTG